MARPLMILPPVIFIAIAALFWFGMQRENPDALPSVLIGKPAPEVPDDGLPGVPLLLDSHLRNGEVTVVNFWASWCPPCRAEHPTLHELTAEGVRLVGVNFKDEADQATRYLTREGNPFLFSGFDPSGRVSIDWGITAPPETFIIAGDGTVLFRFAGPLVGSDYEQRFRPALKKARAVQN